MTSELGLNERAWAIADGMVARAAELRVAATTLASGARVIDAGVAVEGGYGAGVALAELCMGGLGHISINEILIGETSYPAVQVWTDHPAIACMASQYAGWALKVGEYFAMASGPLRARARVETELFERLDYGESATRGVLVLEGRTPPTDEVARYVAGRAGIDPSGITFAIAPTASIAGGVQIVSRILETGLHKMDTLGFDVRRVVSGVGVAPIPPVAKHDLRAIGRTNDSILYGGLARFVVRADDDELESLAASLPSSASSDYGTPFYEIFQRHGGDFYKIDRMLFCPARVWLTSVSSGRTFRGGRAAPDVLERSLLA